MHRMRSTGSNWIEAVQELDFLQGARPDGIRIAATSTDGTIRTFVLSTEELVALARLRVTRSLTTLECQKYLHLEACPERP